MSEIKRYEEHPDGGMREDELGEYVRFVDADREIKRQQDIVTSSEQERYRTVSRLTIEALAKDAEIARLTKMASGYFDEVTRLREALSYLTQASSEVSSRGATTGPQWVKLNVGLVKARASLKEQAHA
jgi:hypothetical protein